MEVKDIFIDSLKEYENNPRNNDGAVKAVAESIKQFGFKVPIVIDENNIIIAGHTRVKAARMLGLSYVPCIIADDLTPEQIKAFRLADNKTGELAVWDFDKLEKELAEIELDMSLFGFNCLEDINFDELDKEDKIENIVELTIKFNSAEDYKRVENDIKIFVNDNNGKMTVRMI